MFLVILLLSFVSTQNLILNSGWEDHAGAYCPNRTCSGLPLAAIYPWYTSSTNKDFQLVSGLYYVPLAGNWTLHLNGAGPYTISQDVTLTPGKLYNLKFRLNHSYNSPYCSTLTKTGYVFANGFPKLNLRYIPIPGRSFANGWKTVNYLFRAVSSNSTVSIGTGLLGLCGFLIDQVYLSEFAESCPAL